MKKFLKPFSYAMVALCLLVGCGNSTIDSVKNGILDFDKSTTIGQAFEGYQYFTSPKWSIIETKQKRQIVQFEAKVNYITVIENMTEQQANSIINHAAYGMRSSLSRVKNNDPRPGNTPRYHPIYEQALINVLKDSSKINKNHNVKLIVQFLINKDDTFNISAVGVNIDENIIDVDLKEIQNIYENNMLNTVKEIIISFVDKEFDKILPQANID